MCRKNKKKKNGCTRSWFNCCVWVAAQLEAPHPILEGKQSRRCYRQHPDLPANIPAFLAVAGMRRGAEGAEVFLGGEGGKAETRSNQLYFSPPISIWAALSPSAPHIPTNTCIFDLIMPLSVAVMTNKDTGESGREGGRRHNLSVFVTPWRETALPPPQTNSSPPAASLQLCIRIHVALWPHTIDLCFLIAPPGRKQYPSAVWLPPIKKRSKCVLSRKTGFYGYLFVGWFVLWGFVYCLVFSLFFFLEDTVLPPHTTSVLIQLWPVQHSSFMFFFIEMLIFISCSP